MAVVASLQGSDIVVAEVTALAQTPLNEILATGSWSPGPSRGELGAEYASRTHAGASEFIKNHDEDGEETVYALRIPTRKEAA